MGKFRLMRVLWPAFLAACALELLVFAVVDPTELAWSGQPLPLARQGVYTLSFFIFWAVGAISNAITLQLFKSAAELNLCPFPASQRPPGCPHNHTR
jgi:hypothetical protein